ncbi:hypothetical protein [Sinorhizobium sp. BG8]|uniref:hypothetical protein n=1 Tax=Sinorhizobium sp. BG8 TaxID=2613773 RepID=UPI00193D2351|nr:hypothetical protein [Sinorhizobium sp. BG8]QRM55742.1 hypothetical protein F3Y30_15305 [Sinorhizobium sp. BG8]
MRHTRTLRTAVAILVAFHASAALAGGPAGAVKALPPDAKAYLISGLREADVLTEAASKDDEGIAAAVMDYYFEHQDEITRGGSESETVDIVVCLLDRHFRPAGPDIMEPKEPICINHLVPADH